MVSLWFIICPIKIVFSTKIKDFEVIVIPSLPHAYKMYKKSFVSKT